MSLRSFFGPLDIHDILVAFLSVINWPFLEWSLHRYVLYLQSIEVLGFTLDFDFAKKHRIRHEMPW